MNRDGHFDFEEPIARILKKIEELSAAEDDSKKKRARERLEAKLVKVRREVYGKLSAWQKTLVARHPKRPYLNDYIEKLFEDFVEVHGDRRYSDDKAIVGGMAVYHGKSVAVVGHQKGRDTKGNIYRNFGMPQPEGYRKALRIMRMAEKFKRPILTFVDTPGAYPGLGAEERGQAEAIAYNLREMADLKVPVIVTVTGEGGSGGALAVAVGDEILMLEYAIYSVISPEGCAAILWKNSGRSVDAAENLKLTAQDLKSLGVIDEIVPEPVGGAHTDPDATVRTLDKHLMLAIEKVDMMAPDERIDRRYMKFRRMGVFEETAGPN